MVSTRRVAASFDTRTFGRFLSTSSRIAFDQSGSYNLDSANQRSVAVSLFVISTQPPSTPTRLPLTAYKQPLDQAFRHHASARTRVLLISGERNFPIGNEPSHSQMCAGELRRLRHQFRRGR